MEAVPDVMGALVVVREAVLAPAKEVALEAASLQDVLGALEVVAPVVRVRVPVLVTQNARHSARTVVIVDAMAPALRL